MTRTAVAVADAGGAVVDGGVEDLVVMKTARSAFSGFPRDEYTTLPEVRDRIMATKVTATWRHATEPADWDARHGDLVDTLLATFADHDQRVGPALDLADRDRDARGGAGHRAA